MQNKFTDIVYSKERLQALLSKLREFRNYDNCFEIIFQKVSFNEIERKRKKGMEIADPRIFKIIQNNSHIRCLINYVINILNYLIPFNLKMNFVCYVTVEFCLK